jgi:parallel beta-helix repeat protein
LDGEIYCLPFKIQSHNSTLNCNGRLITFTPNVWTHDYGRDVAEIYGNNVTIKNCIINNSFAPIILFGSNYTSILNNSITESAAAIQIDYNTFQAKIENNKMTNGSVYHFMIFGNKESDFNHTVNNNSINNRPLLYFFRLSDQIISNQYFGELVCAWCTNVEVNNNNLDGGDRIVFIYSNDSKIQNNNITDTNAGIYLKYSSRNIIKENSMLEGKSRRNAITRGIVITAGEHNIITKNIIVNYSIGTQISGWTSNLTFIENNLLGSRQNSQVYFPDLVLENPENSTIEYNMMMGILLSGSSNEYNHTKIYHNFIKRTNSIYYGNFNIHSLFPIELSHNNQGNYWDRSEPPYFCEYGNQHPNCIDNWDSNRPDVIDSCPYNQSYPSGQWPASPVCPECSDGTLYDNRRRKIVMNLTVPKIMPRLPLALFPIRE